MEGASDRAGPNCRLKQLLQVSRPNQGEHFAKLNSRAQRPVYGTTQQYVNLTSDVGQEDIPYPLTKGEALSFLKNVLEIPNPQELVERDQVKFLDTFIRNMIVKLPFTNLPHVSQPMNNKHCPTFEECKMALFHQHGGHCFYKNVFAKALLDLMGYKTYHVGGNNRDEDQFDTHCGLIVCDLTHPGSLHLAEPGTRRPLYQATPLNFEEESPVYKFHFMRSKFFKREHGLLLWCAQDPNATSTSEYILESEGTFWTVQLIYRLQVKRTRAFYLEKGSYRSDMPGLIPQIHQSVFVVGYSGSKILSVMFQRRFGGKGYIGMLKMDHEDMSQNTGVQYLTEEGVLGVILKHFPQYSKQTVQQVLDNVKYGSNLYSL